MRTALNVSGVRKDAIHRGQAIGSPGSLFESDCINVRLAPVEKPEHAQRVRLHIGTGEFIGRLFLFDHAPEHAQIRLEEPTACARGQRAVIRKYSPPTIIAGAEVVTPNAKPRRKNDKEVSELLIEGAGASDGLVDRVIAQLERNPLGVATERVCEALGETAQSLGAVFEDLKQSGRALGFAGVWLANEHYGDVASRVGETLIQLHAKRPQAAGIPKFQVLADSGLGWDAKPFDRLLAKLSDDGLVMLRGSDIAHPDHRIAINDKQAALLQRVIDAMIAAGASAPSSSDLSLAVGAPVQAIEEMIRLGALPIHYEEFTP